jgi:hypothetical protein
MPDYDLMVLNEYVNEYDDNWRLVKSIVTESEIVKNSSVPVGQFKFENVYTYELDKLVRKDEYIVSDSGLKNLFNSTIFSGNTEEWIGWDGSDTTSYQLWERDDKNRVVRRIERENINVSEFDFVVNKNFEEWLIHDNDRLLEQRKKDLLTGETLTTKFFYGQRPSISPAPDLDVVYYEENKSGDTLVTKRYHNGSLEDIFKDYEVGNHKWNLFLDPDYTLALSNETIVDGDERIEISKNTEFHSIDSLFYRNNVEFKSVVVYPDQKVTTLTDYDKLGNKVKETRYTKYITE